MRSDRQYRKMGRIERRAIQPWKVWRLHLNRGIACYLESLPLPPTDMEFLFHQGCELQIRKLFSGDVGLHLLETYVRLTAIALDEDQTRKQLEALKRQVNRILTFLSPLVDTSYPSRERRRCLGYVPTKNSNLHTVKLTSTLIFMRGLLDQALRLKGLREMGYFEP